MNPVSSMASSGMLAAQKTLAQSAHNTANLHTQGFQARQVSTTDVTVGSQGAGVDTRTAETDAPAHVRFENDQATLLSNTDLISETTTQLGAGHAFTANVRSLQASDEMTESLLSIKA